MIKNTSIATTVIMSVISFFSISSVGQPMTCEENNATTISLYKDIRSIKNRGLLFNDCKFGACAHPEVKAWKRKLDKHNGKGCTDGIPSLSIPYDESVHVGDLYDVVFDTYGYQGQAAIYKFELAMICFENPKTCKKYTKPEPTAEEIKAFNELMGN